MDPDIARWLFHWKCFLIHFHFFQSTKNLYKAWTLYKSRYTGKDPTKFQTKTNVVNKFQQPNFFC